MMRFTLDAVAALEALRARARRHPLRVEARDVAPSTVAALVRERAASGVVRVWSGASASTLWGPPEGNYLFRAWHDDFHFRRVGSGLGFDPASECTLGALQSCEAGSDFLARAAWAEVAGQALAYLETGDFLAERDQAPFAAALLASPREVDSAIIAGRSGGVGALAGAPLVRGALEALARGFRS